MSKSFFTVRPMGGCKDKTICNQNSCLRAENASTASGNAVQTIKQSGKLFPPPIAKSHGAQTISEGGKLFFSPQTILLPHPYRPQCNLFHPVKNNICQERLGADCFTPGSFVPGPHCHTGCLFLHQSFLPRSVMTSFLTFRTIARALFRKLGEPF